ncbi:glycoside hydrolase family 140 protein [Jiulongibacter sp. NS-SX5]|uniref:glycoside hydrolase family 140 protein n=1 Tax=Jiulongibacter sp. NS-SX5 TaxID=3463854 RepID=UPI0040597AEF
MKYMKLRNALLFTIFCFQIMACSEPSQKDLQKLEVHQSGRFLQTADGQPFFWLGDTGWLLFSKTTREEALQFLDTRQVQGYNVVQVMLLHTLDVKNAYGDYALADSQLNSPVVTEGSDVNSDEEYDYWDHVDFIAKEAEKKGIYIGMVPVWGGNVKGGKATAEEAEAYAKFLAERYKSFSNIIWLNGGDLRGEDAMEVWQAIGQTIKRMDPDHLVTYHPFGRTSSIDWFQQTDWLDFHMFQSGHRTYEQDNEEGKRQYGPDNWKYIQEGYQLEETKPILDGEPSYEGIPHGLHDITQPYWNAADLRRYAWWSVLEGGFGFTYGHNAVMQIFKGLPDEEASYGPILTWDEALNEEGANQMKFVKELMLEDPDYFGRKPAEELLLNQEDQYEHITVSQSRNRLYAYTFSGREIQLHLDLNNLTSAFWYNPRNGERTEIKNLDDPTFDPPGEQELGNDWVLVAELKVPE